MAFGEGSPLFRQHYICSSCNTVSAPASAPVSLSLSPEIAFNFSPEATKSKSDFRIFVSIFAWQQQSNGSTQAEEDGSIYTYIRFSRISQLISLIISSRSRWDLCVRQSWLPHRRRVGEEVSRGDSGRLPVDLTLDPSNVICHTTIRWQKRIRF